MALRLNGSTSGYVELNAPAVAGSQSLTIPYGILKVAQTVKTDTYSATSNSTVTDITGMSVNIQPNAAGSKILVMVTVALVIGGSYAGHHLVLKRGSDEIFIGDARGSTQRATMALGFDLIEGTYGPSTKHFSYLDTPTYTLGDTLTYKIAHQDSNGTGNPIYVNRNANTDTSSAHASTASSIIVMEVAA